MGRGKAKGSAGTDNPTVQISREAKEKFHEWWIARNKPMQGAIVGQLLVWFVSQPTSVQRVVLGEIEGEMASSYAAMLRQMADSLEAHDMGKGSSALHDRVRTQGNAALLPSTKNKPTDR